MYVNNSNQVAQQAQLAQFQHNRPATAQQGNLFNTQLDNSSPSAKLQRAADHSGLSALSSDDNSDNWHSVMGQTYGYDQTDPDSEGYQQSEQIRQMIRDGDWSGLDIPVTAVNGDLGAAAAFVGGDTADASDDQILVNGEQSGRANSAITEELFHAFERKINPDQEGDTRLVDGAATFTDDDSAGALDEGELGLTLLRQFNESGGVPMVSDEILQTGGISADDTADISLNGETVSAEFTTMTFDDDDGLGVSDDPDISRQYLDAAMSGNYDAMDVNHAFMAGTDDRSTIAYNENGSRDYSVNATNRMNAIRDDTGTQGVELRNWLRYLPPELSGSQGVQDFIGYMASTGYIESYHIQRGMAWNTHTAGEADWLNSFSFEQLNNETTATDGIRLNPEVLQHLNADTLLGLDDNKSHAESIQHALELKHLQADGTDEIESASEAMSGEEGSPHSVHNQDIVPIDVGASDLHTKYQPLVANGTMQGLSAGVDAEGNWNHGNFPAADSEWIFTHSYDESNAQVIARTADSAEVGLPDNITAIQYSYYAPKDPANPTVSFGIGGHRHDWEDVWVFVQDVGEDTEQMVGAAFSAHGDYYGSTDPATEGNQVLAQYAYNFRGFADGVTSSMAEQGTSTSSPFGNGGLDPEEWDYNDNQVLASYGWLPDAAIETLNASAGDFPGFDAYGAAVVPMRDTDNRFNESAAEAYASLGL